MIKYVLCMMLFAMGWSSGTVVVMAAALEPPCDAHGVGGKTPGATANRTGVSCPEEDVIESEGTRIIGDSDMPKALYIVPWKKPALPTLSNRPITPFINDALSSVNRESLVLRMNQHEAFQHDGASKMGR